MSEDSESQRVAFRPRWPGRLVTIVAPVAIMGTGAGVWGGLRLGLTGLPLFGLVAAGIAVGGVMAVRNAMVGVVVAPDKVVIVNGFKTVRIPVERFKTFAWHDYGLVAIWNDGRRRQVTPVAAFNKMANPMADLTHGQEVWEQLKDLPRKPVRRPRPRRRLT